MKPIDWTKPIQTVRGVPARLLGAISRKEEDNYVVATRSPLSGDEDVALYFEDGKYWGDKNPSSVDIENVPPPPIIHKRWMVWYRHNTLQPTVLRAEAAFQNPTSDPYWKDCRVLKVEECTYEEEQT